MINQNQAIEIFSPKILGFKPVINETSLLIPDGTPFETVERMINTLKAVRNCSLWWIGDALLYSERAFGEKYSQLLDATDYEYSTLRNISYIVSHVAPNIRRPELTVWHHQEVAALPQAEQKKFLKIAVDQKLSAAALRALIKNKTPSDKPNKADTFELALKSILKIALRNKGFDKKAFDSRDLSNKVDDMVVVAVTASDALKAFEE